MPTHGSVAKSVRNAKEKRPAAFCPARNCLWRTFDVRSGKLTPCPKGYGHGLHPDAETLFGDSHGLSIGQLVDQWSAGNVPANFRSNRPQTEEN